MKLEYRTDYDGVRGKAMLCDIKNPIFHARAATEDHLVTIVLGRYNIVCTVDDLEKALEIRRTLDGK